MKYDNKENIHRHSADSYLNKSKKIHEFDADRWYYYRFVTYWLTGIPKPLLERFDNAYNNKTEDYVQLVKTDILPHLIKSGKLEVYTHCDGNSYYKLLSDPVLLMDNSMNIYELK